MVDAQSRAEKVFRQPDKIKFTIPFMLDNVSVRLGPWSGYHVLAQHRKLEVILPLHVLFIILTP